MCTVVPTEITDSINASPPSVIALFLILFTPFAFEISAILKPNSEILKLVYQGPGWIQFMKK